MSAKRDTVFIRVLADEAEEIENVGSDADLKQVDKTERHMLYATALTILIGDERRSRVLESLQTTP